MKKVSVILAAVLITASTAFATACSYHDNDERPITFEQLPIEAQNFVKQYFANGEISYVILDNGILFDDYSVIFANGDKLDFDNNGLWTDVECRHNAVPSEIVPREISDYVKKHSPSAKIVEIKRDRNEWEVKLSGGVEFKFNSSFRLVEFDD